MASRSGQLTAAGARRLKVSRTKGKTDLVSHVLEIAPTQGAHFGHVETHHFDFLGDTDWRDQVAELEPDESHDKAEYDKHAAVDNLCHKLAGVSVEQATDAIGGAAFLTQSSRTTPFQPAPYWPVAKQPNRQDTP